MFRLYAVPDPCGSSPCLNNGTCSANGANFTCYCVDGYDGIRCESTMLLNFKTLSKWRHLAVIKIPFFVTYEIVLIWLNCMCETVRIHYHNNFIHCRCSHTCIKRYSKSKCHGMGGHTIVLIAISTMIEKILFLLLNLQTVDAILMRVSVVRDPCSPVPCLNQGTCVANGTRPACSCPAGYAGTLCEGGFACGIHIRCW